MRSWQHEIIRGKIFLTVSREDDRGCPLDLLGEDIAFSSTIQEGIHRTCEFMEIKKNENTKPIV